MLSKIESLDSLSLFIFVEIIETALSLQILAWALIQFNNADFITGMFSFINTLSLFFLYSINGGFQKDFEKWKLNFVLWRVNSFCPFVLSTTYSLRFLKYSTWKCCCEACLMLPVPPLSVGSPGGASGFVSHMHQIVIQNENMMISYCSVLAYILASFSWKCFNSY